MFKVIVKTKAKSLKALLLSSTPWVCCTLMVVALLTLAACTKFLGDSKRGSGQMKVESQMSCFNQAGETVSDYVAGKVPLAQMDSLIDCTTNAVNEFTEKVLGDSGKTTNYNQRDISVFLDQYLLTSGKFDHKLLEMLFELKASSISGDAQSISAADISKLKALLQDFKNSLHDVDPYLGILTQREAIDPRSTADQQRFEAAVKAFRTSLARLSPYFAPTSFRKQTFTIDEGFDSLAGLGLDMSKYRQYRDLSAIGKQVLVGGTVDTIRAEEWLPLIKRAADGFEIYLRYQTYVKPLKLDDPLLTPQLHVIADQGLAFVAKSLARQDQQTFTEIQLQQIVRGLDGAKLLPKPFTASSMEKFVPVAVEKWLLDRSRPNAVSSKGIGLAEFNVLSDYAQNWLDGMDVLGAVSPNETLTQPELSKALSQEALRPILVSEDGATASRHQRVLSEWKAIFGEGRPWAWDSRGYLVMAAPSQLPVLRRRDAFDMNMIRVLGEAVIRAYAADPQRARTLAGLTADEVQQVYLDIRRISNDLNLIDPRTFDAGSRTFMEMNLFTSSANGDSLMQYREGVDWINFAISSSTEAGMIARDIETRCPPTAQNDVLGHRQLDDACFRKEFRRGFVSYFKNFPNLVVFYQKHLQDDASWKSYIDSYESVARSLGPVPGPIDIGSLRTFVTLMAYNESLLLRFDADQNQMLTDDELWAAFPLIQPLIQTAMAKPSAAPFVRGQCTVQPPLPPPAPPAHWLQEGVFAYLVQNGHPPPSSGLGTIGVPWAFARSVIRNAQIDRLALIKIISSFTTVNAQKNRDAIANFFTSQQPTLRSDLEGGVCTTLEKTLTLFKCDPSAHAALIHLARAKGAAIFADGPAQKPEDFTKLMEQEIQSDSVLQGICSPF